MNAGFPKGHFTVCLESGRRGDKVLVESQHFCFKTLELNHKLYMGRGRVFFLSIATKGDEG